MARFRSADAAEDATTQEEEEEEKEEEGFFFRMSTVPKGVDVERSPACWIEQADGWIDEADGWIDEADGWIDEADEPRSLDATFTTQNEGATFFSRVLQFSKTSSSSSSSLFVDAEGKFESYIFT